jgi:hypothetical protein
MHRRVLKALKVLNRFKLYYEELPGGSWREQIARIKRDMENRRRRK